MTALLLCSLVVVTILYGYSIYQNGKQNDEHEKSFKNLERKIREVYTTNTAVINALKADYEHRFQSISELTKDYLENFNGIGEAIDKLEDRVTKIESDRYTFVPMISNQFPPKNFDLLTDVIYTGEAPKATFDIPDSDDDKYWSIGEIEDGEESA